VVILSFVSLFTDMASEMLYPIMPIYLKEIGFTIIAIGILEGFAEAIAGLYLNKKDNKIIADKIITYFNEHVRSKYFITMQVNDPSYAAILTRKSGVAFEIVDELTGVIKKINNCLTVTDEQLLHLNGLTEKFFKYK
ncbi:MAG: hypothetical protein LH615_05475, partial [Ferruginibacter sp.]|nr:hypothetical protein [Ferruginibacter sp.]